MLLESLKKSPMLLSTHIMPTFVSFRAGTLKVFHAEASFIKAVIIAAQSICIIIT